MSGEMKPTLTYNRVFYKYWVFRTYRVFRKNCVFFTIHCNPSLAYIAARDFKALNAM